jgi:hypothetical protein
VEARAPESEDQDCTFLSIAEGIATVTDGKDRFTIDLSGSLPVYR